MASRSSSCSQVAGQAIAAWQAAGLDAANVRELQGVSVRVEDLGTRVLAIESAGTISINETAAGDNWYVNAGPGSNRAFGLTGPSGESGAGPGRPSADEVDLLTVLERELGHVIGLSDNAEAGDLMDTSIGVGIRRSPTSADLSTVVGASTTTTVQANPSAVVAPGGPRPVPPGGTVPVSDATVDAALASIASTIAGDGDGTRPTIKVVTPAALGPVPAPDATTPKKDRNPHVDRPYPHRNATMMFSRNIRGVGQAFSLGPRTSARPRGGLE